jgi:ligand-binding sensor protein
VELGFDDIFSSAELQRIQDSLALAMGVASRITALDGQNLTSPSNVSRFCREFCRFRKVMDATCLRARNRSDDATTLSVWTCQGAGLWEACVGIYVSGVRVANWLIGQVRDETQSEESMRAYAREIGADEGEVAKAFHQITPMSRERFDKIARALFTMANQLSTSAFQNIQQARAITELKEAEKKLQLAASVFTHAREGIMITAADGTIIEVNDAFTRITGYARKEVIGQTPRILSSGRQEKAFYASLWHDLTDNERATSTIEAHHYLRAAERADLIRRCDCGGVR